MAGAVVDGGVGAGSMWLRAICCGLGTQLKAVKHGVYLILITLAARTQKAKQTHFVIPQLVIFFFFFFGPVTPKITQNPTKYVLLQLLFATDKHLETFCTENICPGNWLTSCSTSWKYYMP